MNFMFEWSVISFLSREHKIHVFELTFNVPFIIDILMTLFLTIFRRFLTTLWRFPKILQNLSEGHMNVSKHFLKYFPRLLKIFKDCRTLEKTFKEDPKVFWSYTNEFKYNLRDNLDISEIIDIFTSEDVVNTSPNSRMWFWMNFMSGVFSSETPVSI